MQDFLVALFYAIQFYTYILIARILCSWLPNVDWYRQPWKTLDALTEPVMAPFRRLIPPLGGLDLSPILLFIVLNLIQQALKMMLAGEAGYAY